MDLRLLDEVHEENIKNFINKQKNLKEKSIQKNTKNKLINKNNKK